MEEKGKGWENILEITYKVKNKVKFDTKKLKKLEENYREALKVLEIKEE